MADRDELLFPDEDDRPLFADEPAQPAASAAEPTEAAAPWRILIVDDEADVHSVTTFMLRGQQYLGRGFEFLHAYSGREARDILAANPDLAVVLLDVVMETEDSGLQLVHYIREELGNRTVRIVLRTGQPGKAPAARVIVEYDINDYKEKTELTLEKMLVTLISALRSYHFITTIENNRRGLKRVLDVELLPRVRMGYDLVAIMVDCDGFKTVNDTLDHVAGDLVLRQVAERIRAELERLMISPHPRRGIELLVYTGAARYVIPELADLVETTDEHGRHKDVYQHTLTVLDQAIALETAMEREMNSSGAKEAIDQFNNGLITLKELVNKLVEIELTLSN